jgi:4-hydroxy-tetrahydrodipicolinate synthase
MGKIQGTLPATVTPFIKGGGAVDEDWIPLHLDYLRSRGVDGLVILGTNGEGPSLGLAEKKRVIDTVMANRGELPVVVGTGCSALSDTIEVSQYALEAGADALLIVPPFFFKDISLEGLKQYYQVLFNALPPGGKVILYNIPGMSGVEISDDLMDALLDDYSEQLLGIKDTSGILEQTEHYIARYPQLAIFSGSDRLVSAGYQAGAKGAISAVANVFPELVNAVGEAYRESGNVEQAQEKLNKARAILKKYPSRSAIKHLLQMHGGLPLTHVRPPLKDLNQEQQHALRIDLAELELGD